MNTDVLPNPPKPHSPSIPEPRSNAVRKGDPVARVTHVLMFVGWIPVDKDTLAVSPQAILNSEKDITVTFMSEGKQIDCRSVAILATKTKYE